MKRLSEESIKSALKGEIVNMAANFSCLRTAFSKALEEAYNNGNVEILKKCYECFPANSEHDKKSPMDQAFREFQIARLSDDVEGVGKLMRLSVQAVRVEIVSVTIPVVLLGDIFDTVTLEKCERIFVFVEEMLDVWKEDIFFSSCKNNLLRMCNDLLRRLSRVQNTVFCGRILLFLSKFFPFSERSGLNIASEFNLENITEYAIDDKDPEDELENTVEDIPIKLDYKLYSKFWSLQDFFRNPTQCYGKAQWKMFQSHTTDIVNAFASFKLEDESAEDSDSEDAEMPDNNEFVFDDEVERDLANVVCPEGEFNANQYFAKFLTNPKLLSLQLSDAKFRRSVLVQLLIIFQYLDQPVRFKSDANTLTTVQLEFIKEMETKVQKLLEETPPCGKQFATIVQKILKREEIWNKWKNDGCKEVKKPVEVITSTSEIAEKSKPRIDQLIFSAKQKGEFYLGNETLTRLWNLSPDNLEACKSSSRKFLPPIESYLENTNQKNNPAFEWRALRLLARQSPYFFAAPNSSSQKISDYLDEVKRKINRDKLEEAKAVAALGGVDTTTAAVKAPKEEQKPVVLPEQEQLMETEPEAEGEAELEADDEDEVPCDLDNEDMTAAAEEKSTYSIPTTATREHMEDIAPLIGDNWKKLGKKLGYTLDELLYFETQHKERNEGCVAMLSNWFADDDDATLENWAYILEGLEMNLAATAVKALIERLAAKDAEAKEVKKEQAE